MKRTIALIVFAILCLAPFLLVKAGTLGADQPTRYLIIAVDGVGYDIAEEMHRKGELKNFPPPRPLINAFPSTTNPGLIEILQPLGAPVSPGYEDVYFDPIANKMRGSVLERFSRKKFIETTFRNVFDYHPHQARMTVEYALPLLGPWLNARFSMARLKKKFLKSDKQVFHAYVASSDLAIHLNGRWLLRNLMKNFDEMAGEIKKESKQPVEVILYSDHGNQLTRWRRAGLRKALRRAGFKLHRKIKGRNSVVLPQYGLIASAHIQTQAGRESDVADALAGAKGVDLSAYRDGGRLHIVSASGRAVIERRVVNGERYFRYQTVTGDPLELNSIIENMRANGVRDYEGFIAEEQWLRATAEHTYPDPLRRLWDGFGWVTQPVSVLVSMRDGYYTGSIALDMLAILQATHGNLRRTQSRGVLLSTDTRLFQDEYGPFTGENLMGRIARLHRIDLAQGRTAVSLEESCAPCY